MVIRGKERKIRVLSGRRWLELCVLIVGSILLLFAVSASSTSNSVTTEQPPPEPIVTESQEQDFSRFLHTNPMHQRLPCLLCHKRDDNSAIPKRSGHLPCSGCHVQQFAEKSGPMCTICHTNTDTGALKGFPPLRSFSARFDHAKHIRQTGCATCHRSTRGGAVLSIPSGASAHVTCFQCHKAGAEVAGRNIGSCNICHELGRPTHFASLARPNAVNFSHSRHIATGSLNCTSCHTPRTGGSRTDQVSEPVAAMHFAPARAMSCASCHNSKRAFGPANFNNCRRCHTGRTFKF
ncbi:MAG: cytochrome c3 family protein [Acidobacteriota bacterium]